MKRIIVFILAIVSITRLSAQIQYDSIYTSNENVITGTIKEVTANEIKFLYPGEDVLNTLPKIRIQKIVFKSGRVQVFSESSSLKKITSAYDWENVSISKIESEVQGLFKIGDISVKAKNQGFASSSKINDRAYRKLKIEAAMQGANIVFITSETSVGNKAGTQFQAAQGAETQISGITYSNSLPKFQEFLNMINDKTTFVNGNYKCRVFGK